MYDFKTITSTEVEECGKALVGAASGASSMEDAATSIVRHLYDNVVEADSGQKSCALVRFYKTHKYRDLEPDLQEFARGIMGGAPETPDINCLTLLGTAGDNPAWNSRANSNGHKAIPLVSEEFVAGIPMLARLLSQFGVELSQVVSPEADLAANLGMKTFNSFYIPEAQGSPYIPAQDDFIVPNGVQSALGVGGVLGSGDLFVLIIFSKTAIPEQTASRFSALAAGLHESVAPFVGGRVFN